MPDLQALATTEVSDHVRQLVASGDKMGAMKAYRDETNVDLRTASQVIESLYGG
jgi:soluble P-type ATPase